MASSPHACRSRIVRGLAGPLWFVALLSVSVGCYESARENGMLPAGFGTISLEQQDPFQLSSFALSLLLVRCLVTCRPVLWAAI